MMKSVKIMMLTAVLWLSSSCSHSSDGRKLTVSIEPQRYLLEAIAGPKWQVTSLLSRGEDPESFDPPMSALRDLYDSQAYFPTGTIEFERHILDGSAAHPAVFDTSKGIHLLSGTHSHTASCTHAHHHSEEHHHDTDPHVWSSLRNARVMALNMLDAMIRIDSADSAIYRRNYNNLCQRLDSADRVITHLLAHMRGETFMVWHPSLSYFASDYNLHQLPLGHDGKELSVKDFRENIDHARLNGARVFLVQPDFDAGRSVSIASEAGVHSCTINTLAYDFPEELIRVARIISCK